MRRWWGLLLAVVLFLGIGGCGGDQSTHKAAPVVERPLSSQPAGKDYRVGPDNNRLHVHFIDVGQGDSILVLTPDGEAMLVDGGDGDHGQMVVDYLRAQGVKQLAVLVATHPHADHIGGLEKVLANYKVKRVYMPRVTNNTDQFAGLLDEIKAQGLKINTAGAGVNIPLSGVQAVFVAPGRQAYENINDYSAVLRITYGKVAFLLAGDAGEVSENEMLAAGMDLRADVLKVGHHGSHSSTGEDFLQAVAPRYAVIMCGLGNDYGHPHWETLESLSEAGVRVYRSDLSGNIVITCDGDKIDVKTEGKGAASGGAAAAETTSGQSATDSGGGYIGNRHSHKFHRPTCSSLPQASNQVFFNSREEAVQSDYSPCGRCRP